ncbi:MAG: EamA family transporter, partial [Myxococcota bacterium]
MSQLRTDHGRGLRWAFASVIGSAGFVIPWKMASAHGSAATNTLILLVAAASLTTLLTIVQQKSLPSFSRFDLRIAMGLAIFTLFGNLASANAIALLSPALLTVFQRSEIIIIALLAWPLLGERIDRRFWLGAGLALAGLILIQGDFSSQDARANGMAWAGASAFCFASMSVLTRKTIHQINPVSVNALRLWLAVALWFGWNGFPAELQEISGTQLAYASLAAFFGPFMARLCLMMSAKTLE